MTNAIASGKIILLGEHAVVHGYPAIGLPLRELNTVITVFDSDADDIRSQHNLSDHQKDILHELVTLLKRELDIEQSHLIKIQSSIPIGAGLGSSASLCTALIKALIEHHKISLANDAILSLLHQAESLFHGNPSGLDHSVVWYDQPIYFQMKISTPIKTPPFMLFVIPSSTVSDTKAVVDAVQKQLVSYPDKVSTIFANIQTQVDLAKNALEDKDLIALGECMTANHELLQELGVSNQEMDEIVDKALHAGALGAKLTGAGKGGHVIALCDEPHHDQLLMAFRDLNPLICVIE